MPQAGILSLLASHVPDSQYGSKLREASHGASKIAAHRQVYLSSGYHKARLSPSQRKRRKSDTGRWGEGKGEKETDGEKMSNCLAFSWQSHHDVCLRN